MADFVTSIAKLDLAPGDIVVIKSDQRLSAETARCIQDAVKSALPNPSSNKVLVVDGGLEISVLKKLDVAALAA